MKNGPRIIVDGDRYVAAYKFPAGSVPGFDFEAHVLPLAAGAYFVRSAVAMLINAHPGASSLPSLRLQLAKSTEFPDPKNIRRLFTLKAIETTRTVGNSKNSPPCIRSVGNWEKVSMPWNVTPENINGEDIQPSQDDIRVDWLADEHLTGNAPTNRNSIPGCSYHIQAGTLEKLSSQDLALPKLARLVITSLADRVLSEKRIHSHPTSP